MASYNKITLIGNVGRDPEIRQLSPDRKVVNFSIAVNDAYTDRNGVRHEKTEWFRIEFWNQKADVVEKYVRKGTQIFVEGKLSVRTYQDKDGKDRYSLDVLGTDFTLLGSREGGDQGGSGYSSGGNSSGSGNTYTPQATTKEIDPPLPPAGDGDDDLPF
ncbi:single-stranded DNA-binding protein [Cytophagaceae bacterium DM2B3-1]|uniref:Single-stranded DNA-binding protein n=2 Tax=Xanthocytophaga TaxID=3078918 RepID=A0AAE3U801_9BACT|nr:MULTISPECIES: single-stranded DNA-binding protein [Xanthocytophaga]MDJ1468765.1 single-stranded DNA-binding protein [Xanthocytophaga flavus]MDJ1480139.1 single-stranded DNA-binding protein [Xanthocytophaga flavus]MDJ1495625.1 single-stranded DNA-binding protein [Xanthocytophaga flavus]MDJ1503977.1 single-stranded DNA-binding protein [Xanthocytophaga agilis]